MSIKDNMDIIFGGLIAIVVITVLTFCVLRILYAVDIDKWNNGKCECGGKWEYQQAIGHYYSTHYLYECDTCGKIYEFFEKR